MMTKTNRITLLMLTAVIYVLSMVGLFHYALEQPLMFWLSFMLMVTTVMGFLFAYTYDMGDITPDQAKRRNTVCGVVASSVLFLSCLFVIITIFGAPVKEYAGLLISTIGFGFMVIAGYSNLKKVEKELD